MSKNTENFLSFWQEFINYPEEDREECLKIALESIRDFEKGRPSREGEKLIKWLQDDDMEFMGMVPNLFYFRVNSDNKEDLETMWVHPFSLHTLAYKHKTLPFIVLSNANIEYNKSVLTKLKGNKGLKEMYRILGITG
jgi:hypothetical protein